MKKQYFVQVSRRQVTQVLVDGPDHGLTDEQLIHRAHVDDGWADAGTDVQAIDFYEDDQDEYEFERTKLFKLRFTKRMTATGASQDEAMDKTMEEWCGDLEEFKQQVEHMAGKYFNASVEVKEQ